MNANRGNQPSQSMRDHLVLFEPNGRKMLYEFVGPFVSIGRSAENDIVLPHANISRVHLQLTYSHDGWQAVDTGGVSGTYSGAYRLQPNQPYTLQPQEGADAWRIFTLLAAR